MDRDDRTGRPAAWRAALSLPLVVLLAGALIGVVAFPTIAVATSTVQTIDDEVLAVPPLPDVDTPAQRSLVFARDGSEIGVLVGAENRVLVGLDAIPEVLRNAVIATEDADFWSHDGVNERAVLRALVANLESGEVEQGGSTITQQYVKNALLTSEQTLARKIKEAVYATRLEEQMTKEEILERYLNLTYFGNGAYGVAAASELYFGRPVGKIDLPRAALLAGMIRRPVTNDPIAYPENAQRVKNVALGRMLAEGYITREQADRARAVAVADLLDVKPLPPPRYPFFTEYVKRLLLDDERLGETRAERAERLFSGGLRIHTTIDVRMQGDAMAGIREHLKDPAEDPLGGLLSVDTRTGQILAMAVGPKRFGSCEDAPADACEVTKVNPLVPGLGGSGRQVGSTFKPILDTAALTRGIPTSWATNTTSGAPVDGCWEWEDGRQTPWTPENYSETGGGVLDMPAAMRLSNNVYHAKLIAEVGPEHVVDTARKLGIDSPIAPVCAIALGSADVFAIDMVEAFATLANEGVRCTPFAITKVTDAKGNVLLENHRQCERVIPEDVAATMVTMMREVVERGTATRAQIGRPVAGKTGTTNDFRDAWFLGFTRQVATAAWVGYELPRSMYGILGYSRVAGGTVPAAMWASYMGPAMEPFELEDLPDVPLDRYTPPKPKPKPKPKPEPAPAPGGGNGGGGNDGGGNGGGGGNSGAGGGDGGGDGGGGSGGNGGGGGGGNGGGGGGGGDDTGGGDD